MDVYAGQGTGDLTTIGQKTNLSVRVPARSSMRGTGSLLFAAAFFFGTCSAARAQERVVSVKMLAPGAGWAIKGTRLFWISSNGAHWTDITPPAPSMVAQMASIFFLNTTFGWVLFARGGEDPLFDLASTSNAGASWSVTSVTLPPQDPGDAPILGGGRIAFADPAHGWMNIAEEGGAAFAPGALAMTTDGGRTWNWAPSSPGVKGSLVAVTPEELWLAGGPDYTDLYVTYDGARSWNEVNLPAPKEIEPANHPTYDMPTFLDAQHGFEPVTFKGPGFRGAAVLFATIDGGRTWRADRHGDKPEECVGRGNTRVCCYRLDLVRAHVRQQAAEARAWRRGSSWNRWQSDYSSGFERS